MNDPNYTSGVGAPFVELYNQAKTRFGYKGAATPNEVFSAVAGGELGEVANQTKEAVKGTTGFLPAFIAHDIDNVISQTKGLDKTPEANSILLTLKDRMHDRNMKIAEMAAEYKDKYGVLNAGWDKQLLQFFKDPANALMTPDEEKNIHRLAGGGEGKGEPAAAGTPAPAVPAGGKPIYDKEGKVRGYQGADGKNVFF
jgi:hypothetical protein